MENYSERLIDYLDKQLTGEELTRMEIELERSPELAEELKELRLMMGIINEDLEARPSNRLQHNFDKFLEAEIQKTEQVNTPKAAVREQRTFKLASLYKYAAAAVALILIGVLVGRTYTQDEHIDRMSEDLYAMLEEKSTSQRIKAVNMSQDMAEPNAGILDALINTMNTDKSSNVRLAAVTALEKFTTDEKVINAFINSLGVQDDPTVTIALINILASIKEQNAIKPLEQLLNDDKHMQFVKDEAQVGIFKLTSI